MNTMHDMIRKAIDHCGSQSKLAKRAGCSQQQIAYLLKAENITAEMAIKIDHATEGAVSRRDLRPDVFGQVAA